MLSKRLIKPIKTWLNNKYGSNKGFIKTYWYSMCYWLGRYNKYKQIDWNNIERLVFVCKGNICRSAFAETVARRIGIDAISCGLHAVENAPANEKAIRTAQCMGYDLSMHRTTPIMYPVLKKTDLLIVMEPLQSHLIKFYLARLHYVTLLGLWVKPVHPFIYDPYGSSPEYFRNCFNYIEKSVYALADKTRKAN